MRILLLVEPDRPDFYAYLARRPDIEFSLLWFERPELDTIDYSTLPVAFADRHYWRDYATPNALLEAIRPDKIVFFEIIDLRQIALIVAARAAGITTIFLEHGAANDAGSAGKWWSERGFWGSRLPYLARRLTQRLPDLIAAKLFYYAQHRGKMPWRDWRQYLALPIRIMRGGSNHVLSHNHFPARVPDWAIIFNELNFEYFQLYTGAPRDRALFTGVPLFDRYYADVAVEDDHIVFIDHPYLEDHEVEWTAAHHRRVATALYEFAKRRGVKIFVKLHPRSSMAVWQDYGFDPDVLEVVQHGDYTSLYLSSKLILGFSSSLLIGLLSARKNVVLLGWNPRPHIFGQDFSESGLCHRSLSIDDLDRDYDGWLAVNKTSDEAAYQRFLSRCNSPFDGQATERVLAALETL